MELHAMDAPNLQEGLASVEKSTIGKNRMTRVPWTFAVVLVAVASLTIFFGAWAVSVDQEATAGGQLGAQKSLATLYGDLTAMQATGDDVAADGYAESSVWWQKSLLLLCPLH